VVLGYRGEVSERTAARAIVDLFAAPDRLWSMARVAAGICDGLGASRVADIVEGFLASAS
jgi:hypothetical protein